ncbi:MAG: ABC transporter permease [Chloroflexota bacterium]|nr:ABC transporter permease [Chloroflexota bacterium]
MNPLSLWTFYRRRKRRAILLLSLISLVTAGVYLMVALSWAIFIEPVRSNYMFLSKFSVVWPDFETEWDTAVMAQIRANPDVAQVFPIVYGIMGIQMPDVMGGGANYWNIIGLREEDVPYVLERCEATLKEGQMLQPRTNGILLSKKVAAALDLQVGDTIHSSVNPDLYSNVDAPLEVIGILESDLRLAIYSYEYIESHELYHDRIPHTALVVAQEGREAVVDDFLRDEIQATRTIVLTLKWLAERMTEEYLKSGLLLVPIIIIVTIVITLVIGVVNRIALIRRLPEFGLLHAAGYSKKWLTRRLTWETGALAAAGWVLGIGLSWLSLYVVKLAVFAPRGHDLTVIAWTPAVLAIPIPLSVIGFTRFSVGRVFSRLDAVAVVERGELSLEQNQRRAATAASSSPKPLASLTFYRRHKQRAVLLTGVMALMIMAVVLVIFLFSATHDAQRAALGYLSRMSRLSPLPGWPLDPAMVAQIRTHPAVERIIPVAPRYAMLTVFVPPLGETSVASPFGVYAEDMAYLVELYDLTLKEGRLPRPRTNEMVIPEAVAQNRDLQIGDVIGDPNYPAYPGAFALDAQFVVSGIFAKSTASKEENWLGFVSLEFLESHEAYHIPNVPPLFVVPKVGQKAALDDWLESELDGKRALVYTRRQETARAREKTRSLLVTMLLVESVIAVVAAITLAVLNYIFVSQRQSEFSVLHALGYGRLRLVWHTVRETAFTTGTAWGLSVILCLIGLLYLQFGMFAPLGLRLDFFNLTPWLFTLPIPIAVLAVTSGTVARTLSKLDPVSIIERQ